MARYGVQNQLNRYLCRLTSIKVSPVIEIRLVCKKYVTNQNWFWMEVCGNVFMLLGAKKHGWLDTTNNAIFYDRGDVIYQNTPYMLMFKHGDVKFKAEYVSQLSHLYYTLDIGFMKYTAIIKDVNYGADMLIHPTVVDVFEVHLGVCFSDISILTIETSKMNYEMFIDWVGKVRMTIAL